MIHVCDDSGILIAAKIMRGFADVMGCQALPSRSRNVATRWQEEPFQWNGLEFSIKVFNLPTDFRGAQKGSTFQLYVVGWEAVAVSHPNY